MPTAKQPKITPENPNVPLENVTDADPASMLSKSTKDTTPNHVLPDLSQHVHMTGVSKSLLQNPCADMTGMETVTSVHQSTTLSDDVFENRTLSTQIGPQMPEISVKANLSSTGAINQEIHSSLVLPTHDASLQSTLGVDLLNRPIKVEKWTQLPMLP